MPPWLPCDHAAWPSRQLGIATSIQQWETVMGTHSNLKRFVCLALVLAASVVGVAYDAQAGGGLNGGAASAFVAPNRAQVLVSATAVLSGSGQYVRPGSPVRPTGGSGSPCGKGGCPKR